MTPRIVSWKTNESCVSPSLSSAGSVSVVSINSIVSDTMTTGATGVQPAGLGAKLTNWPGSANPTTNESFVQHDVYFFKDGNITFLVRDGSVLCVQSTKKVAGRRHTLLCSSLLLLSGLGLLFHQIYPARCPRSSTFEYYHITGRRRTQGFRGLPFCPISQVSSHHPLPCRPVLHTRTCQKF
jgi:hypothetical protein